MFLPRFPWTTSYSGDDFRSDVFAGLTTAVMLIPQAMAYALLAGLPIEVGLYASTIPVFVYAFWGTGRVLAVGPVAVDSLLCAAAINAVSAEMSPDITSAEQVKMAALLAFMTGVVLVLMGVLKLGRVVSLLTPTIITAFTSAAAIIIGINQLKLLLGVNIIKSSNVYLVLMDVLQKLSHIHIPTLILGTVAMTALISLKVFVPKIPRAFVAVILGIAVVILFDLGASGVQLVGDIPAGLPSISTPWLEWNVVIELLPHAVVIAIDAFMEAFSINTTLQKDPSELEPSRELIALGGANIASGLFQGYSVTGGFSRSAVNSEAGAKTQVASLITGVMVLLTLGLFYNVLADIPKAVLGAIILTAVVGLINIQFAKDVFLRQRVEIPVYVATLLPTLFIGIKEGLIAGIIVNWIRTRSSLMSGIPDSNDA